MTTSRCKSSKQSTFQNNCRTCRSTTTKSSNEWSREPKTSFTSMARSTDLMTQATRKYLISSEGLYNLYQQIAMNPNSAHFPIKKSQITCSNSNKSCMKNITVKSNLLGWRKRRIISFILSALRCRKFLTWLKTEFHFMASSP